MRNKSYKRRIAVLAVLLGFLLLLLAFVSALYVASFTCERSARVLPSYERTDVSGLFAKEVWTENDIDVLYHQTGLGEPALRALKEQSNGASRLLEYQNAFFYKGELIHDMAAITTPHDRHANGYAAPLAPIENGDLVLSSACHTFGWRNGHASIVVNAKYRSTLESFDPSSASGIGNLGWFLESSNFLVLRLKKEVREELGIDPAEVAKAAVENLCGIAYDLTVGVLSPKDQCKDGRTPTKTQCAHIVWQAYKNFGLDIDSNGGAVVVPRDIARCDYFEVVQVNGFDPDRLW